MIKPKAGQSGIVEQRGGRPREPASSCGDSSKGVPTGVRPEDSSRREEEPQYLGVSESGDVSLTVPDLDTGGRSHGSPSSISELRVGKEQNDLRFNATRVPKYPRRKLKRAAGDVEAHARFLQAYFRLSRAVRPGCWRRGGMAGLVFARPVTRFGCCNGLALASWAAIRSQRLVSNRVVAWYSNYVRLHRRLHSGKTPTALVPFCGEGGSSEGIRRAGGASHGQDLRAKPAYVARFGAEAFSLGDSKSPSGMAALKRKSGAFFIMPSPPCKEHSTARMRGKASDPPLIRQTRAALRAVGGLYAMENVTGARTEMPVATTLRGSMFGLHVDRPRLFESNFHVHVDRVLKEGGEALRPGMCLGDRRRWRRIDPFGRPEQRACCAGNTWAVQGDKPFRCTADECADAMGIDRGHMSYEGLTQAVPPVYAQLIFGQACMRAVEQEFAIRPILFDEYEKDPEAAERRMAHLLLGAGGVSPSQGVEFVDAAGAANEPLATKVDDYAPSDRRRPAPPLREVSHGGSLMLPAVQGGSPQYEARYSGRHAGGESKPPGTASVREAELRELEYSWAGGFDAAILSSEDDRQMSAPLDWYRCEHVLAGGNTLISVGRARADALMRRAASIVSGHPGTRVTIEARSGAVEGALSQLGFRLVRRVRRGRACYATDSSPARSEKASSFWALGEAVEVGGGPVDYAALEESMDPRDRTGGATEPKEAKAARSYMPIPWEPSRWDIGLPDEIDAMMARKGVGIHAWEETGFSEVPFYPFASDEGLLKSIQEADRALVAGAMEYVPEDRIEEIYSRSTVHPWTIVDQGGGKWRLCHDYSVGTNRVAATAPFHLPSVWDVVPSIAKGSFFAKYDIRDGFWHCPIDPDSRHRLVVRHPGTGRLMWASRLPFGYLDSPRLFCGLTEALVQRVRDRAAAEGLEAQLFCFVDDVLCTGVDEATTRRCMELLEDEFRARGVQWAPNKTRGPCQVIEFLGLLLSNVEGRRGVTVTRKRLEKLQLEIEGWLVRAPREGTMLAEPREVASLMGKLVFASQVVAGGRTYLQCVLSAFKGLIVDWRRGTVSVGNGRREPLRLGQSFWRDLRWWKRHLHMHAFVPFDEVGKPAELVLAGTDASDWGTGQVIWRDGGREEHSLEFTYAERRRSINWRELLGIYRVCRLCGERLRGKAVLIEADNMAAVGAAGKLASKAADMQELVRRVHRLSTKHGFSFRVTHTPGEKLDRPDQTSRGDPIEEPRARLDRVAFGRLVKRYGGFSSFIGPEREHEMGQRPSDLSPMLWVHPTFSTVGTALRRVGEQLGGGGPNRTRALALVPVPDGEQWASMLRHGTIVGRLRKGDPGLELNVLGRWRPSTFRRPMLLVLFPRAAGATPRPVRLSVAEGLTPSNAGTVAAEAGYELDESAAGFHLQVLPGSFGYTMPQRPGELGMLVRFCEAPQGNVVREGELFAQQLCKASSKAASALAKKRGAGWVPMEVYHNETVFRPDPSELWMVDDFVAAEGGGKTFDRFVFSWAEATRAIAERILLRPQVPDFWHRPSPHGSCGGCSGCSSPDPAACSAYTAGGTATEGYECFEVVEDEEEGDDVPGLIEPNPEEEEREERGWVIQEGDFVSGGVATPSLDSITRQLDSLNVRSSPSNRGPEGRVAQPQFTARGGQAEGIRSTGVEQVCPYAGTLCAGCGLSIGKGETMRSHLDGVVHPTSECTALLDADFERRLGERMAAGERLFYAVYSEELGASGVYETREEAVRWLTGAARAEFARMKAFATHEEATRFIRDRLLERSTESVLASGKRRVKGSSTMRALTAEKLSAARMGKIDRCIAGDCGIVHDASNSTPCRGGCGRRLHMMQCAEVGKGYAAVGNFTCPQCRGAEMMAPGAEPTELVLATAAQTMVMEMTQGAESTGASYAAYEALEERYTMGMGQTLDGQVVRPRHSEEAYKNFLTWMTLTADRARSLESVHRSAGAFMSKVHIPNLTKSKEVDLHYRECLRICGREHEASTAATPRMLVDCVSDGGQVDKRFEPGSHLNARWKLELVCEGVGGCRIGEVVGGGDGHGLLANNTCIQEDLESGVVCVEGMLEHSKTKFSRYLNMAGITESGVNSAEIIKEYWRLSGMETITYVQAGVRITRPDFWVVRVSLAGLDDGKFNRLFEILKAFPDPRVRAGAKDAKSKASGRRAAGGAGSQERRYINVAAGKKDCRVMALLMEKLNANGFIAQLTPGPLILATTGGASPRVTHMPLQTASAGATTSELLTNSWRKLNSGGAKDPDLDVEEGSQPLWTTHSLRRLADTVARRDMLVNEISEQDIDLYFGWNERILKQAMQRHYAAMSVRERMKKAVITRRL